MLILGSLDSDLSEWTSVESRERFEGLSRKWGSWINCWKSNLQQTMIARAANPATWVVLVNPKPFFESNEPASKGNWTTMAADGIMTYE
jgi:hypothetical protein